MAHGVVHCSSVCMYVFDLNPFIYKETFAFYLYFINFWKGSIQHLSSLTAFFHLFLNISSSAYERLLTCQKIDIYNKLTGLICEEVHIWDLESFVKQLTASLRSNEVLEDWTWKMYVHQFETWLMIVKNL